MNKDYTTQVDFLPLRQQTTDEQPRTSNTPHHVETYQTDLLRSQHGIEVNGFNIPVPVLTFENFGLPYNVVAFLKNHKQFCQPTPIQMQSFSCLRERRDCICLSSTGSGKSYGYILPLIYHLSKENILEEPMSNVSNFNRINSSHVPSVTKNLSPYGLVIVPTRELMNQVLNVTKELTNLLKPQRRTHKQGFSYSQSSHQYNQQQFSHSGPYQRHRLPNNWIPHPQPPPRYPYQYESPSSYHLAQAESLVVEEKDFGPSPQQLMTQSQLNGNHTESTTMNISYTAGFCGGIPIKNQLTQVSQWTKIIISTPGRLIDMCERGHISLESVKYFVIDECDKLLEQGMEEQLRKLVAMVTLNKSNITCSLWSATLPESLERLARSATVDTIYICTGVKDTIPKNIAQNVFFLHTYLKPSRLLEVLRETPYPPVIIFTSSKHKADELKNFLEEEQFHAAAIHSDKSQQERNEILQSFRNDEFDVLVATDLISRGLDLPAVTHVINFDTPDNIEDYVHRCGRTGRFGRPGQTTTFLTLHCKIASELKDMLESCGSSIPYELHDTKMFGKNVLMTEMGDRVS